MSEKVIKFGLPNVIPDEQKEAAKEAAKWARGCEMCVFGIVSDLSDGCGLPLPFRRAIANKLGGVIFCSCKAGQMQRRYTDKMLDLIEEKTMGHELGEVYWLNGAPTDYIPGSWWTEVKDYMTNNQKEWGQ